jgi:hypothetical protein
VDAIHCNGVDEVAVEDAMKFAPARQANGAHARQFHAIVASIAASTRYACTVKFVVSTSRAFQTLRNRVTVAVLIETALLSSPSGRWPGRLVSRSRRGGPAT